METRAKIKDERTSSFSHLCGAADRARTGMVSLPRDFKAERPQNEDICESQKFYKTGRFCAETRQKTPEIRPFPSVPILPRFVIFPLLPKTFHTQNGRHFPMPPVFVRTLYKLPPRLFSSKFSNTPFCLNRYARCGISLSVPQVFGQPF